MRTCKACGHESKDYVTVCPVCENPLSNNVRQNIKAGLLLWLLIPFAIIALLAILNAVQG